MNAWSGAELNHVITTLDAIKGARLQEVLTTDRDVGLGFYAPEGLLWVWIDLDATRPTLLPWDHLPLKLKWSKSPLNLFLRAHFVGRTLGVVRRSPEFDRVIELRFGDPSRADEPALEVRLIPHVRNVIARVGRKSVAWQRPRPLDAEAAPSSAFPPRDLTRLRDEWLQRREAPRARPAKSDPRARAANELTKRERALVKVDEELARKRETPWREVGDWLKSHQTLEVPQEFEPFVDRRRKLAWNIETCFEKARELAQKLAGTEGRREILVADIARLRQRLAAPDDAFEDEPLAKASPLAKDSGKGRTLKLDHDISVVAGKSAADNLKLLRRARAWDYWIHLRDYPSAHAIVFRNKNQRVGDDVFLRVAAWFVKLHLGEKHARASGQRFELLIAECRFVRPIKGDKLGRVTYRDERTLIYRHP